MSIVTRTPSYALRNGDPKFPLDIRDMEFAGLRGWGPSQIARGSGTVSQLTYKHHILRAERNSDTGEMRITATGPKVNASFPNVTAAQNAINAANQAPVPKAPAPTPTLPKPLPPVSQTPPSQPMLEPPTGKQPPAPTPKPIQAPVVKKTVTRQRTKPISLQPDYGDEAFSQVQVTKTQSTPVQTQPEKKKGILWLVLGAAAAGAYLYMK